MEFKLGRVFNSLDSHLNGLKMAKSCQTLSNSWLISRYYLRYFPCLTAIYLIFITIFEMKTRPNNYLKMKTRPSVFHLKIPHNGTIIFVKYAHLLG